MLNELNNLAQKKSKAEKVVQKYNKKKEEEKIRKSVQSDKLEEFFEPVTKAVAAIPTTPAATPTIPASVPTAVGQLIDVDQPAVPNIMDTPVPPALPEQGSSGYSKQDAQITEIEEGGVNLKQYDAERVLENSDLTDEQKLKRITGMNIALGLMKSKSEFPQEIVALQDKK